MTERWIRWGLSGTVFAATLFIAVALWRMADTPLAASQKVVDIGVVRPESENTVHFRIKNRSLQTAFLTGIKER